MGIGMGALIAGLFGMNVSPILPRLRNRLLTVLPLAYEPYGRAPVCLCGVVCHIHCHRVSRCMGRSSKVCSLIHPTDPVHHPLIRLLP